MTAVQLHIPPKCPTELKKIPTLSGIEPGAAAFEAAADRAFFSFLEIVTT